MIKATHAISICVGQISLQRFPQAPSTLPSAPVPDAKPQKKRSPPLGWGGFILGVLDVIYMK